MTIETPGGHWDAVPTRMWTVVTSLSINGGVALGRIVVHEAKTKQVRALQDCEDALADHSPRMRMYTQVTR